MHGKTCGYEYCTDDCEEYEATKDAIVEQAEIVRQRITYHFGTTTPNGGYIIPKGVPFMREFLNEIDKLLKMIEEK